MGKGEIEQESRHSRQNSSPTKSDIANQHIRRRYAETQNSSYPMGHGSLAHTSMIYKKTKLERLSSLDTGNPEVEGHLPKLGVVSI